MDNSNNFFQSGQGNLSTQINKAISYRIIVCFLLAISVVLIFALNEIYSSSNQLQKTLDEQCQSLEEFVISQVMIKNDDAIQLKLDALNQNADGTKIFWDSTNQTVLQKSLRWQFPLSLVYFYPVKNVDGTRLGTLIVTNPLLNNHGLFSDLLTKIGLLLLFFIIIFVVLNPLSKRIPQRLFITPINNLLSLLRNDNNNEAENTGAFPEEINEIRAKIMDLLQDAQARSHATALGQIATQVAHDIRSPLLVLKRVLDDFSSLPEKKRIDARNAIQRVTDIANNLLAEYKQEKNSTDLSLLNAEPVAMMLESIVSEKRIQVADLSIDICLSILPNAYDAFVHVDIAGFKRVLSNLINNSIDAVKGNSQAQISLVLQKTLGQVIIIIQDNGYGIPQDKLHSVLDGVSFGKKEGSGLGLPYSINKISAWNGDYTLRSEPGTGTEFKIILPESSPAAWFREQINVKCGDTIVVLDDDDYIHQIWDERFPAEFLQKHQLQLFHFTNPHKFLEFYQQTTFAKTIFLLDYELGINNLTGMQLAKILGIGPCATLVTSRYEDEDVRDQCEKLALKILPKSFAEFTPIHVFTASEIVFIDDEKNIGEFWKDSAESAGKTISIFNNPLDFMQVVHLYPKNVAIYIDSSLGNGAKGEDFAKILYEQGYQNIVLATGFPKERFKHITWIKDVIGKEPPWGY